MMWARNNMLQRANYLSEQRCLFVIEYKMVYITFKLNDIDLKTVTVIVFFFWTLLSRLA